MKKNLLLFVCITIIQHVCAADATIEEQQPLEEMASPSSAVETPNYLI